MLLGYFQFLVLILVSSYQTEGKIHVDSIITHQTGKCTGNQYSKNVKYLFIDISPVFLPGKLTNRKKHDWKLKLTNQNFNKTNTSIHLKDDPSIYISINLYSTIFTLNFYHVLIYNYVFLFFFHWLNNWIKEF